MEVTTTELPCGCVVHETTHYKLVKHCHACMKAIVERENRHRPPDNSDLVGG